MTRIAFTVQAPAGTTYAPDAFSHAIGQKLDVELPGGAASGRLLDSRAIDAGRDAQLTMEVDEATARRAGLLDAAPGGYSLGFDAPYMGVTATPTAAEPADSSIRVELRRLRLPLDNHGSELLLVGDRFEQGGQYVQLEVPRAESEGWSWLDWDDCYDRLAEEWRRRFGSVDRG